MKKIIAIILAIGLLNSKSISQVNGRSVECDSLIAGANRQFGCGISDKVKNSLLKKAADCYKEKDELEKAIKIAESNIQDINEQTLGRQGWIEKLVEYQRIKNGDEYVRDHLNELKIAIQINESYFEIADTLTVANGFEWGDVIWVSVVVFGKQYGFTSTVESHEKDNQVCDDFLLSKISKDALNAYFYERWQSSLIYKEIEKIR